MRRRFSDVLYKAVADLCMEMGVSWRYGLTDEQEDGPEDGQEDGQLHTAVD